MAGNSFKKRVCLEIMKAAKSYKEIYLDYEYLICSEAFVKRKYYIVDAQKDKFQHLTGVHSRISPQIFYEKYCQGTLSEEDFDFVKNGQDEKSVKGTVRRKINVLPNMMNLFKTGLLTEESFVKNKICCSFATADGSCTLGFSESEKARPKSLIKGNELCNPQIVDLVLRKKSGTAFFDEIVIGDERILYRYRSQIEHMLAECLKV